MIEIKAFIQPFKRPNVIEALRQVEGLPGITVDEHVHFVLIDTLPPSGPA